jgi:hypothetical protein
MPTGCNRRTSSILAVTLPFVFGCSTWEVQPRSPDVVIQEARPDLARFTIVSTTRWSSSGRQVVLEEPIIVDSMFVGTEMSVRREIPLQAVSQVELKKISAFRTAACIVGLAAVGVWAAKSIHISDPYGSIAHW